MSKAWANGSTRAWRKVREFVLQRDGYRCQLAIAGLCVGRATHVHHIHGVQSGDAPEGLQATCQPCNARVSDPLKASIQWQVVTWIRSEPAPKSVAAVMAAFSSLTQAYVRQVLRRAASRGELIKTPGPLSRTGKATVLYSTGPTGVAQYSSDPSPRPLTRWSDDGGGQIEVPSASPQPRPMTQW